MQGRRAVYIRRLICLATTDLRAALPLLCALYIATGMTAAPLGAAEPSDLIVLRSVDNPRAETRLRGTVVDYTGAGVVISVGGVERRFAAEEVARIETPRTAEELAADRQFDAARFRPALEHYAAAARREERAWARRRIMARMIWCYRNLGETAAACDTFLLLLASDPGTIYFDAIPLAWTPARLSRSEAAKFETWLNDQSDVAALLGASHLLATSARRAASDRLERLAASAEARVALLASAQLWRLRIATVRAEELDGWRRTIDRMPEPLGGGPYYTLGLALAHQGNHRQAATALLRTPILYAQDRPLAGAALVAAARSLEKIGLANDAARLLAEAVTDYADTPAAAEATRLLAEAQEG